MSSPTKKISGLLRAYEAPAGTWPMIWERARGTHVWDAEGRKYLDLTAAFGVAAAGHANPRVVGAGKRQMEILLHAMGDVHPHALKAQLLRELSRITFERWTKGAVKGRSMLANSGFEAVEIALKTAVLVTGRRRVLAFHGAYHGLGYGALNGTHRDFFRAPFRTQLGEFGSFVPFPKKPEELPRLEKRIRKLLESEKFGAILVEPIQARGGINVPPAGFLPLLRKLCDEYRALLVLDEIYTGFGRTGKWFATEHSATVPDLICLGKALTGGFPLSACVGRADLMMRAWPPLKGESIHTSTFQGHPVGCAMALAQINEIERLSLAERSAELGAELMKMLESQVTLEIRGCGLMVGIEIQPPARGLEIVDEMLWRGFIVLAEGELANVISLTPPLTISRTELLATVQALHASISTKAGRDAALRRPGGAARRPYLKS